MTEHDVIDRLRAIKPASIQVIQRDGKTVAVPVPAKGQRWSRVWSVIAKLPWQELRALNRAGEVLDILAREPQQLEDIGPGTASASILGREGMLLQVLAAHQVNTARTLAEAMRSARQQAGEELMAILDAHRQLATDAFSLRAEVQTENNRLRGELEELRDQLREASSASSSEARDAMLMELFKGMQKKTPAPPKLKS